MFQKSKLKVNITPVALEIVIYFGNFLYFGRTPLCYFFVRLSQSHARTQFSTLSHTLKQNIQARGDLGNNAMFSFHEHNVNLS